MNGMWFRLQQIDLENRSNCNGYTSDYLIAIQEHVMCCGYN